MRRSAVFIISVLMFAACDGSVNSAPTGSDLATAPLGGEYYGEATLQKNTCDNPDPMSDAFKPFPLTLNFYPENEEQTSLTVISGSIKMQGIMPVRDATSTVPRFTINYKTTQDIGYVYLLALSGTVEAGEMNLVLYEGAYGGTKDNPGDLLCEASYKLHLEKILNFPYVSP